MKIRIPARLLWTIRLSPDFKDWLDGKGCLATDRDLFSRIHNQQTRADGSLHIEGNDALAATVHQWALILQTSPAPDEIERKANIRTAKAVIRNVT